MIETRVLRPHERFGDWADVYAEPMWSHEDVYNESVKGRHLLFFDTGIWIELTDGKTDVARTCAQSCISLVQSGRLLVPLSVHALAELLDNPIKANKLAQAKLMDRLSLGTTFRPPAEVIVEEAHASCPIHSGLSPDSPPLHRVFTYPIGHSGQPFICWHHSNGAPNRELLERFRSRFRSDFNVRTVEGLLRLTEKSPPPNMQPFKQRYSERVTIARDKITTFYRSKGRKPNFNELVRLERDTMFREYVAHAIAVAWIKRFPEEAEARANQQDDLPESHKLRKLREFFRAMPSAELSAQVYAARDSNCGERTKPNDLHDNGVATLPPAYVNAVAVRDRNLADLLAKRVPYVRERGCRVLRSVAELSSYIDTLK